jgi:lactoylglutathione lyase
LRVRSWLLRTALILGLTLSACQSTTQIAFDHAGLEVHDLQKSASFYLALGLYRIDDPFKDARHVWMSLGRGQALHLLAGAAPATGLRAMDVHLALRVRSIDDVVMTLNRLNIAYFNSKKVPQTITTRADGVKQIYLQDPDGYWLEINDAAR